MRHTGALPAAETLGISSLNRRALTHLRAHLDAPAGGTDDDPELAAFVAELVNRAAFLRHRAALEGEVLNLRKARLDRRISDLRAAGAGDVASLAAERSVLQQAIDRMVERESGGAAGVNGPVRRTN